MFETHKFFSFYSNPSLRKGKEEMCKKAAKAMKSKTNHMYGNFTKYAKEQKKVGEDSWVDVVHCTYENGYIYLGASDSLSDDYARQYNCDGDSCTAGDLIEVL